MYKSSLLALAMVGFAGAAFASPITYTFRSIATGTVNGETFTEAPLTITLIGDTDNVRNDLYGSDVYFHTASGGGASFVIGGGPSGTFSDQTMAFVNQSHFGGTVGFTATSTTLGFNDVIQIHGDEFGSSFLETYDLKSNTGLLGHVGNPSLADFVSVQTSAGLMDVTWMADSTFQATPEPATMAVLGLGALAAIKRRKR